MRRMKNLTRRDWLLVNALLWLGLLVVLVGALATPSAKNPPLNVGPLVPATAEEARQWEVNNLADWMEQERGR